MNDALLTETPTPWSHLSIQVQVSIELAAEDAYNAGCHTNPHPTNSAEAALYTDMWIKADEANE